MVARAMAESLTNPRRSDAKVLSGDEGCGRSLKSSGRDLPSAASSAAVSSASLEPVVRSSNQPLARRPAAKDVEATSSRSPCWNTVAVGLKVTRRSFTSTVKPMASALLMARSNAAFLAVGEESGLTTRSMIFGSQFRQTGLLCGPRSHHQSRHGVNVGVHCVLELQALVATDH